MALIPMKRLQAIVPEAHREQLIRRLMQLGCVEIADSTHALNGSPLKDMLKRQVPDPSLLSGQLERISAALATLDKYGLTGKRSLFAAPRRLPLPALDSPSVWEDALEKAQQIVQIRTDIEANLAEEARIEAHKLALLPWQSLDVPLDLPSLKRTHAVWGVLPASLDMETLNASLLEVVPECVLQVVSSDREQHYVFLIYHGSGEAAVDSQLKEAGFSRSAFKNLHGTAGDNIALCDNQIRLLQQERSALEQRLAALKYTQDDLEAAFDGLTLELRRLEAGNGLWGTGRAILLEGWVPAQRVDPVEKELVHLDCAYDFREPLAGEEPPVAFAHNAITAPFGIISALYGTPRYGSVVDPTPYMAPFFFIFFGMMVSDAAYGVILSLTALWALRQIRHEGFLRQVFVLILYCGLSTFIWGTLFGSWFGDIVPAVTKMLTGTPFTIRPVWFDPLKEPMTMLIFSFALGGLQILTGLGLAGWRQIRSGRWHDALYDVGFWYLILIGLVLALLKLPYGLEMAAVGAAGVVLTAGRRERNPLKRVITGLLALYSVTGYLADVLSYSRLLALGLASAVIASVINAMGTIGGRSLGGMIALFVIFVFGHLFNLAINLVGAYVHASRLQYVEFFSKFYEGGGRPFTPFAMDTRYVRLEDTDE